MVYKKRKIKIEDTEWNVVQRGQYTLRLLRLRHFLLRHFFVILSLSSEPQQTVIICIITYTCWDGTHSLSIDFV